MKTERDRQAELLSARLVVLEILVQGRFRTFRNELFPFVSGYCHAHGVHVQWWRFATAPQLCPDTFTVSLSTDDAHRLEQDLAQFGATHVLINEKLDGPVRDAIRQAVPEAAVLNLGERSPREPTVAFAQFLASWLGRSDAAFDPAQPGPLLIDACQPRYDDEPKNEPARSLRSLITIAAGAQCVYHRSLAKNPCFADLDLSGASRTYGCSFCGNREVELAQPRTAPVELAIRQVAAATASLPASRRPLKFLLSGAVLFFRAGDFFRRVLELGLPPTKFYFAPRIDGFLRMAPVFRSLLPELRRAGHSIRVLPMGVENFSREENERLNKGVTPEQVVDAYDISSRLESEFPDAFQCHKGNRFGFILFTPWTAIDDLRVNLKYAERVGVDPGSLFLRTRAQLIPGEPMTLLAQRDGLCGGDLDHAFHPGFIHSWNTDDLPWRFSHPEVRIAYAVMSRLGVRDPAPKEDPEYHRVQQWRAALPAPSQHPFRIARVLLDVLQETPDADMAAALAECAQRLNTPSVDRSNEVAAGITDRIVAVASQSAAAHLPGKHQVHALPGTETRLLVQGPAGVVRALVRPYGGAADRLALLCRAEPRGGTAEVRAFVRDLAGKLARSPAPDAEGPALRLLSWLEEALFPLAQNPRTMQGFEASWPVVTPDGAVVVCLFSPREALGLRIWPGSSPSAYRTTAALSLAYLSHTPPDTPTKLAALDRLTVYLRTLEARRPQAHADHRSAG